VIEYRLNWRLVTANLDRLMDGLVILLTIASVAFLLALVTGLVLVVMRMSRFPLLHTPALVFIELLRGIPLFLFLLLVYYGAPSTRLQQTASQRPVRPQDRIRRPHRSRHVDHRRVDDRRQMTGEGSVRDETELLNLAPVPPHPGGVANAPAPGGDPDAECAVRALRLRAAHWCPPARPADLPPGDRRLRGALAAAACRERTRLPATGRRASRHHRAEAGPARATG
jgi:His/Glu/Gln/Arg/opine family amino acid ABC transporter permease subunit